MPAGGRLAGQGLHAGQGAFGFRIKESPATFQPVAQRQPISCVLTPAVANRMAMFRVLMPVMLLAALMQPTAAWRRAPRVRTGNARAGGLCRVALLQLRSADVKQLTTVHIPLAQAAPTCCARPFISRSVTFAQTQPTQTRVWQTAQAPSPPGPVNAR